MTATTTAPDCERPDYWQDAARLALDDLARWAGEDWPAAFAGLYRTLTTCPHATLLLARLTSGLLGGLGRDGHRRACRHCRGLLLYGRLALEANPAARAALRAAVLNRLEGSVAP